MLSGSTLAVPSVQPNGVRACSLPTTTIGAALLNHELLDHHASPGAVAWGTSAPSCSSTLTSLDTDSSVRAVPWPAHRRRSGSLSFSLMDGAGITDESALCALSSSALG